MLWATVGSMAKREEVTFEVLTLTGTRWETQGVYKTEEQNQAISDAKSLEKVSLIKGVKVVKEFYDDKAKTSRTQTVYESKIKADPAPVRQVSPKLSARAASQGTEKSAATHKGPAQAQTKKPGASPSEDMVDTPPDLASGEKRPSLLSALLQIIASLVAAAITAIAVTQLATVTMRDMRSIGFLGRDDFLILVFILVFVITALALITRVLSKMKRLVATLPSLPKMAPRPQPKPQPQLVMPKTYVPPVVPVEAKTEEKASEKVEAKAEEKIEEKAPEVSEKLPDDVLSEIIAMNAFTHDVLDAIKGDEDKRDAHTIFGMVLFLVGAVQALRAQKHLKDDTYHRVVYETLGKLGLAKERAQHFLEHTDDYLVSNARYSQMFQSGRNAMSANLESGIGPRGALMDVLNEWDKPKSQVENSQPVTVLFTDIAGSTAMTQKLGDAGAQEVVRAHNTIVRDAIKTFAGKEIKHTGDGIMASFPTAVAGVEAALDMQIRTQAHNKTHPELPLQLKIGLNAGDPIAEDDDLFGTTVQLAARIVDKAQAGQVLVSASVHGLSQGKNLKFERFGDLEMKGFDETITVYAALWEGSPPVVKPEPAKLESVKPVQPVAQVAQQTEKPSE